MALKLIIQSEDGSSPQELLCEQSLITFGRSKSCTVNLEQADVSRRHFIIRFTEDNYVLVDEGSTAGTILDGIQLDPKNCYELGRMHEISVPGFSIKLWSDQKAPRQERTTVMARKLMGKILDDANDADNLPRLIQFEKDTIFYFHNDKVSFVLGTLNNLDFIVDSECHIAKEHVSFFRDISGVRIIPIIGAPTWLNDKEISDPEILNHNDRIRLGTALFVYQEYHDNLPVQAAVLAPIPSPQVTSEEIDPLLLTPSATISETPSTIRLLDRACWGLLAVTFCGMSWFVLIILLPR
jgi:pSer/pThr/pTyr-binding forkhead associated (FHA) protein